MTAWNVTAAIVNQGAESTLAMLATAQQARQTQRELE